jgi:hypothetical protein
MRLSFYAGVPPIRLHDAGHGAACLAHASGASMKAIQALLLHASYSITADLYTRVFAELGEALVKDIAATVPRRRPVADSSDTAGITRVSQLPSRARQARADSVLAGQRGGAPGARTQNPRIKSQ